MAVWKYDDEKDSIMTTWICKVKYLKNSFFRVVMHSPEVIPDNIVNMFNFYVNLSRAQREELVYIANGYSILATMEKTGRDKRSIGNRRTNIRDALGIYNGKIDNDTYKKLILMGVDPDIGTVNDISSFFIQPKVSYILRNIAWFYGENVS